MVIPTGSRMRLCMALMAVYAGAMGVAALVPAWGNAAFRVELLVLTLFGLVHGSQRYGWSGMFAFLVIMWVVVNLLENLSIATGVPFGHFQHTPQMGPKLFQVPVLVGFAYFSAGYVAWILAQLILEGPDQDQGALARIGAPLLAMLIVTAWDVCIDPIGGTVARNWIWPEGGGYFGVPVTNFVGWMVTAYLAFQLFALLPGRALAVRTGQTLGWWLLPAIHLVLMGLQFPLNWWALPDVAVTDPGGTTWRTGDIYAGTTVVSVFTLQLMAVIAILVALRRRFA